MPKKGSTHPGRSPTPSTDSEPDLRSSKKSSKNNQSKRRISSHHKGKRGSHRRDSSDEKEKRIPNQNDLEAVDTKEIKELIHPIHLHLRILMRRPTATSPIPPPPTSSEKLALEDQYREAEYPNHLAPFLLPHNPLNRISNQVSNTFYQTL
ncbi:uncharacterized protein MELLADRAFT_72713 [Melampsora larici-populina 98AG31]|uniref:Uncharacterized protein n=1 Tax=Melampsora larici-populina (strain 98AG31 / pathotype 3-4-7) TaxID=747676 RepID=F4RXY7_MELLP|nr:uncharacterized protein MELLADRAFT_72713 [Melampsora larici-populina 98AG31]EGG02820.1 hypothetical protein MELLADRAFT_72713 [Melampsora larici-populina 98AG31]